MTGTTRIISGRLLCGCGIFLVITLFPIGLLQAADVLLKPREPLPTTSVQNPNSTRGGSAAEAQDEAERRTPETLRHRNRAVTQEDYESLAPSAPGVAVHRVTVPAPGGSVEQGTGQKDNPANPAGGMVEKSTGHKGMKDAVGGMVEKGQKNIPGNAAGGMVEKSTGHKGMKDAVGGMVEKGQEQEDLTSGRTGGDTVKSSDSDE